MTEAEIVMIVAAIIGGIFILMILSGIRTVNQGTAVIVQRFGKYNRTLQPGLRWIFKLTDKALPPISLKEQAADFSPQSFATKDNVTVQIAYTMSFQVVDPKLFAYGIERPLTAIENLTASTLRDIFVNLDSNQILSRLHTTSAKVCEVLNNTTNHWGIQISRVELRKP